jgi:hypothetical protein
MTPVAAGDAVGELLDRGPQGPAPPRSFGVAPARALQALRAVIPWQQATDLWPELPAGELVYAFMQAVPTATFMGGDAAEPTAVRARTRRAVSVGKRRRSVLRRQARERTPGPQALIVRK